MVNNIILSEIAYFTRPEIAPRALGGRFASGFRIQEPGFRGTPEQNLHSGGVSEESGDGRLEAIGWRRDLTAKNQQPIDNN